MTALSIKSMEWVLMSVMAKVEDKHHNCFMDIDADLEERCIEALDSKNACLLNQAIKDCEELL
jgi:hypothetical protein